MNKLMCTLFMLFSSMVSYSQTLDTPDYIVTITCESKEYEVGCNKVTYTGVSKKSGNKISLVGKQIMKMCADGVTPCHSLGYVFENEGVRYFVSEDGVLTVTQGDKTIIDQSGLWKD